MVPLRLLWGLFHLASYFCYVCKCLSPSTNVTILEWQKCVSYGIYISKTPIKHPVMFIFYMVSNPAVVLTSCMSLTNSTTVDLNHSRPQFPQLHTGCNNTTYHRRLSRELNTQPNTVNSFGHAVSS